jgi:phospholipase C
MMPSISKRMRESRSAVILSKRQIRSSQSSIARWVALLALCGLAACSRSVPSLPALPSGTAALRGEASTPIKHIVIVVQENRSFNDFFATFPGANGTTRGQMKVLQNGKYVDRWVDLQPHSLLMSTDIAHCHSAFKTAYDNGKMDGFNLVPRGVCNSHGQPAGTLVYQYVRKSEIQPYWDIAEQYVLADAMFETQGSGSFTAHQDLIRGSTAIDATHSIIDNPTLMPWGCDAPGQTVTSVLTTGGKYLKNQGPFPCSNKFPADYQTLRDLLDAKGVSWKYYSPCFSGWNKNNCDKGCPHTCAGALLNAFDVIDPVRYGSEWGTNVSMPETNFLKDVSGGSLPAVSWIIPADENNDHPGEKVDHGPAWVASIVNAVGTSAYWKSTAIVILWDDWGGMYDNAKPPFQDHAGGLGFRVPCLIVSPYARTGNGSRGGYVAHTHYEFGSVLRYVEQTFKLGSLGTTDARAKSILNVFDYSQSPRKFTKIQTQFGRSYFESRTGMPQHGDPE